jgi:hypothetical protein
MRINAAKQPCLDHAKKQSLKLTTRLYLSLNLVPIIVGIFPPLHSPACSFYKNMSHPYRVSCSISCFPILLKSKIDFW